MGLILSVQNLELEFYRTNRTEFLSQLVTKPKILEQKSFKSKKNQKRSETNKELTVIKNFKPIYSGPKPSKQKKDKHFRSKNF